MKTTNCPDQTIRTEYWSYEELSKLNPISINRNTDLRVERVFKRMKDGWLPTHSIFIVGHATKAFDSYKKNDMFVLDGNTRLHVFKFAPQLIPKGLLTVNIINIDNWEQAQDIYYSIDNLAAAETNNEKITGIFEYLGYVPVTKVFKNGKIKRAIDFASKYDIDSNGLRVNDYTLALKVIYYFDILKFLDISRVTESKVYSPGLLSCLIIIGKKYGINHERYALLCKNLKNGFSTYHDENEVDGVFYVYEFLYSAYHKDWTSYGVYDFKNSPALVRTLYSLDMFMKNINIEKSKKFMVSDNTVPKKLESLFKDFLKKEDLAA
jgi:hypothetical protein